MKKMAQSRKDRLKKALDLGPKDLEDSATGMRKTHEPKEESDIDKAKKMRKMILRDMKKS